MIFDKFEEYNHNDSYVTKNTIPFVELFFVGYRCCKNLFILGIENIINLKKLEIVQINLLYV